MIPHEFVTGGVGDAPSIGGSSVLPPPLLRPSYDSVVEVIEREYWPPWMTVFVVFATLLIVATWAAILACVP